jgi:hypothetical protein
MPLLTGRRLVIATPDGEWRDVRATSEPHERDDGGLYVLVCAEDLWYRWSLTGERIKPTAVPIHLVWVE